MGRRKIEMKKVQDTNTKQVTFSKRRSGLFKKAAELATLCNAEVGILVFSPGNKPYPYGSPCFDSVVERYNNEFEDSDSCETSARGRGNRARQRKRICQRLNTMKEKAEAEKERGDELQNRLETGGEEKFDKPIEELSLEDLKEYEAMMVERHGKIECNIRHMQVSSTLISLSNDTQNN